MAQEFDMHAIRPTKLTKNLPFLAIGFVVVFFIGHKVYKHVYSPYRSLQTAIENWDKGLLNWTISKGANVDTFVNNIRPVALALREGKHEFLQILVDAGAKLDLGTSEGGTILSKAYKANDRKAFEILAKAGASTKYVADSSGYTILSLAVRENNQDWLPTILAYSDVNMQDAKGRPPLHYANTKDGALAKILLDAGANPNATDKDGNTAAHVIKQARTLQVLHQHGADLNLTNGCGIPAMAYHVAEGRYDSYKYLLNNGGNLVWEDDFGNNILYYSYLDKKNSLNSFVKRDFTERHPEEWENMTKSLRNTAIAGGATAAAGTILAKKKLKNLAKKRLLAAATGVGAIITLITLPKTFRDIKRIWGEYQWDRAKQKQLKREIREQERLLKEQLYKCYDIPV